MTIGGNLFLLAPHLRIVVLAVVIIIFDISIVDAKKLSFMNATSASTNDNSTRIQFEVTSNGMINFGTGGTIYEILSVSSTNANLRYIGTNGNVWYQKIKN